MGLLGERQAVTATMPVRLLTERFAVDCVIRSQAVIRAAQDPATPIRDFTRA